VDRELGIFRVSELPGHVRHPDGAVGRFVTSPTVTGGEFIPKPVRVIFGAKLRPRLDVSPGRPVTQEAPRPGDNHVPEILSDEESWFTSAFTRARRGVAEPVEVDDLVRRQLVTVRRPDLVELIPMRAEGNSGRLEKTAYEIAVSHFSAPDKTETQRLVVARPWYVNPDGKVAGVQIKMRPGGKGFETTIYTGKSVAEIKPGRTRVRPIAREGQPSDAAEREGLAAK